MKCVICGKEFKPINPSEEVFCPSYHSKKCMLCGGDIDYNYSYEWLYCNRCMIIGTIITSNIKELSYHQLESIKSSWWENSQQIRKDIELIFDAMGENPLSFKSIEIDCTHYNELYNYIVTTNNKLVYDKIQKIFVFGDWVNEFNELVVKYQDMQRIILLNELFGVQK